MTLKLSIPNKFLKFLQTFIISRFSLVLFIFLAVVSVCYFQFYLHNGLGLAYNDARSHLDIGRRVVEGLKPGIAQIGSVWLPLTHLLMVPTIWNDFMWHTGLAGAIWSMFAFVATGLLINLYLQKLKVGLFGRLIGVLVFVLNLNVLYLQSTAMTELMLLFTMTAACYYLMLWHEDDNILNLTKSAFFIMLASLIRYDGWFLLGVATVLVVWRAFRKRGIKAAEGTGILFVTLGAFGVFLWLFWNQLIFKDWLYFAFGPYSARSQQLLMEKAGNLPTKGNWTLSVLYYGYALLYNSYTLPAILALFGLFALIKDRILATHIKTSTLALLASLAFNILALYLGHSVLFIQGLSGNSWFNVRYGVMLAPTIAIFIGFLVDRLRSLRWIIVGLMAFVFFFAFANDDAVTIDDARVGSSQKNVTQVASWLHDHAANQPGYVLISAASHDAIIFSSGLPMGKFIHEGTGLYWESATAVPDRWARWIIMRTYDDGDQTWKLVSRTKGFARYDKVESYPFADIYELRRTYFYELNTGPIFGKQK